MLFSYKAPTMGLLTNEPLIVSRRKILTVFSLAATFLTVAAVLVFVDPILAIAKYRTRVAVNSSIHELLKETLEVIHISAYLFNITNADKFLAGEDHKLKVEEVGPFTYKELRENRDLQIDEAAGVIRYSPHVTPIFMPDKSVADPRDVHIVVPNIAFMTMVSMMTKYPFFTRMAFNVLVSQLKTKPLVSLDAHSYLWGYNDSLLTVGNTFMPGWINFDTIGLMDRMYDKKSKYKLELGATNDDKFMIKQMNGCGGLKEWGYKTGRRSKCNSFINAYEGIGYPNDLTPKTPIRVYRNVLCRMLELDYKETTTMDYGAKAMVYTISNRTFQNGPDKDCTCGNGLCVDGLSDLAPCFYDLPLAMSRAHFLYGGPELTERIEGLNPDEKKHGSEFMIEPKLGAVLKTWFAMQVNIVMGDVSFNSLAKHFSNMYLPVGHFKIVQAELPDKNKADFHNMYVTGPYIVLGLQLLFSISGTLLFFYGARLLYWNWLCNQPQGMAFLLPQNEDEKKMPLAYEMPLLNSNYDISKG